MVFFVSLHLHVMVEELLQFLVDKVDGDLLEAVVFKDLEPGDVKDGAEVRFLQGGVCGKIRLYLRLLLNWFNVLERLQYLPMRVSLHFSISHLSIMS